MQSSSPDRRFRAGLLAGFAAAALLCGCGTLSSMPVDPVGAQVGHHLRQGDLAAEVDELAKPLIDGGNTPGMVVGVLLPDGSSRFFGYGVADKASGQPPDADTLFAIGSLSKGFVGAIADQLVQEGQLSWDDTLAELLPDAKLSRDAGRITLLQLATHTSGLPRQPITERMLAYFVQYLFTGESFYRHIDQAYLFDYLAGFSAPAEHEPRYSNIGYATLCLVLERRTGLTLDELLARRIAGPLGLRSTGYRPELLPGYATRAHGYAGDQPKFIRRGQPTPDWQFTPLMRGSAGAYASARDLLRYAQAHLEQADTPLHAALDDTLKVRFPRPKEGAAIAWITDDVNGQRITYQIGLVAGYTSYVGLDTANRTAVVVLQNSFNWTGSVGHRLLLRLAAEAAAKKAEQRVALAGPGH
ncbi:serine hydrolase domain-containing protein [Chitinimonas koreensis]|uniref:serine hydrolase domain-containing protein n=1 Tax=Chitinimonas koreensis TaxID=356302 RepID=UPI0004266BA6|nr:serine hydrolase domain-containing protein [Chitinimonas koreensis]QNM95938.1 beta-lactamase family protein [Chitinimonas koreensis]